MKIIIMGHGHFASGILTSLELIAGQQENIETIDFTASMSADQLRTALEGAITSDEQTIILCDLLGGTPFNVATLLASQLSDSEVKVLAGLNLAMLLEIALGRLTMTDCQALIEKTITSAKNGIVDADSLFSDETQETCDSGI